MSLAYSAPAWTVQAAQGVLRGLAGTRFLAERCPTDNAGMAAFLLYVAGPRAAGRNLDRYARSITLSDEERHRLPGLMITRPLMLDLWSVAHERLTAQQAITRCRAPRARAAAVAAVLNDSGQAPHSGSDR